MANPSTYPSDGRITSLQNYTTALVGTELLMLVAPGNATAGVNYNVTVAQMLSGLLPALPAQSANVVLAGPSVGPGTATPTFRSLVLADLPLGTSSFPLVGNGVSAPAYALLTVPGGGSGTSALTANGVLLGNGASAFNVTNAPATGQVLAANNGTAVWTNTPAVATSLQVPLISGGAGSASTLTIESTSGAGTSDAIIFETGSQTQAMQIVTGGEVQIGPQTSGYSNALLDINYTPLTTLRTPQGGIQQVRISSQSAAGFLVETFNPSGGIFPAHYFRASAGTAGAQAALGGGRIEGAIFFEGYNGAAYGLSAQIVANSINQQSATDSSGNLQFSVAPAGTTTLLTAVTFQGSGGVSIGTTSDLGNGQLIVNTAIMSPLHIGGQNATSTLTLESTSGTGTGDAIIFETGAQAQRMRITSGGEVLIGPAAFTTGYSNVLLDVQYNTGNPAGPQGGISFVRVTGPNAGFPGFLSDAFGGYSYHINRVAAGTLQSPTASGAGTTIAAYYFQAYNGVAYVANAGIIAQTLNQQSSTDSSGRLVFQTTPSASTTLVEAMRIQASGGLSIGTTTDPGTGGFINTGTATVGGALAVGGAGTVSGELSVGGFLNATALAVGTTTNPGTNALQVIGTATVGGLLSVAGAANITGTATITNYANASSLALGTTTNPGAGGFIITGTATVGGPLSASSLVAGTTTDLGAGLIQATRSITAMQGVALVSGGTASGYDFFSVANFGIFAGTGVPTIAAGTGSLYLRNDGSTATTRIYVNQNGSTTWTAMTTQA
jgi:hypothetical protein